MGFGLAAQDLVSSHRRLAWKWTLVRQPVLADEQRIHRSPKHCSSRRAVRISLRATLALAPPAPLSSGGLEFDPPEHLQGVFPGMATSTYRAITKTRPGSFGDREWLTAETPTLLLQFGRPELGPTKPPGWIEIRRRLIWTAILRPRVIPEVHRWTASSFRQQGPGCWAVKVRVGRRALTVGHGFRSGFWRSGV